MNRTSILGLTAFALLGTTTAFGANDEELVTKAKDYVRTNVADNLRHLDSLKDALRKANTERSTWSDYEETWKGWNPAQAETFKNTYGYCEWLWSARKDKSFRAQHTESAAAKALKELQAKAGGTIDEFFVTDARGGNVAQSQPTSDWFQGDEAKFKDPVAAKDITADKPKRDETTGHTGVHVSVPLYEEDGTLLGVAVVMVVVD